MRKFCTLSALVLGSTLMASAASQAADNGIYIGAGVGQSNVDVDAGIATSDHVLRLEVETRNPAGALKR